MAKDLANVRIRAADDTGAAFDSLKRRMQDVDGAFGKLKGMMAGVGAGLSAGAFAAIIKSSIDAADHLNDLRKITGMTVESIGGLGYAGRQAGVGVDEVAHGLSKLSKTMLDAATGNKEAAGAFGMLGVSVKDAGGQLRSSEAVFLDISEKFSQLEDGAGKAAVAQRLFGRGAAQLIPMLNEGKAALAAQRDEYARYSGVTQEVAERADAFNDRLEKLKLMAGGSATTLASELLPAMDNVVLSLIEFSKESTAAEKAGGALSWTLKQLVAMGMGVSHVFGHAGRDIGAFFAAKDVLMKGRSFTVMGALIGGTPQGGLDEALKILKMRGEDQVKENERFAAAIDKLWEKSTLSMAKWTDQQIAFAANASQVLAAYAKYPIEVQQQAMRRLAESYFPGDFKNKKQLNIATAVKETKDEFAALMSELSGVDSSFSKNLQTLYAGFKQGRIGVEDYNAAVEKLLATKTEAGKAFKKFQEEGVKRLADEEKKRLEVLKDSIDTDQKQLDAMIRSNEEFGKSTSQIAMMNLAKLEATRAALDYAGATWQEEEALFAVNRQIAIARKMVGAAGQNDILQANDALEKKRREDALRTAQTIESSLTDALLRGFESGKDFAANFRDTLVNMFKTLVLRPLIQFIVSPISGAITAALGLGGLSGAANAAGGGGAGGGFGGLSSLPSLLSGQGVGRTISDLAMMVTGRNILPNALNVANWQYGVAGVGGGLVGGAIGGKTGATLGSIGGTIGMAWGGPIGAVAGSVIGGVIGKITGGSDKPKKIGHRLVGELSMEEFVGQGYKLYKGGKQKGYGNIDYENSMYWAKGAVEAFSTRMKGILDYGKQLGLNTSELAKTLAAVRVPIDITKGKNEWMPPKVIAAANAAADALEKQFIPALLEAAEYVKQLGLREQELMTRDIPDLMRDVHGKLGIDTLLEAQRGLRLAEFNAPLDRIAAVRAQLGETYTRGIGGDLGAVNAFPQMLQSALGIGRDVFASGSGFQEIFLEGNRMLNELLTRQRGLETDILADVPLTIKEASQDQLAALRAQTNAIVAELREVRAELVRLREAA